MLESIILVSINYQDWAVYYFKLAAKQLNEEAKMNLIALSISSSNVSKIIFNRNNKSRIEDIDEKENFKGRINSRNFKSSSLSR